MTKSRGDRSGGRAKPGAGRGLAVRVRAAGRTPSQRRWLERQLNDPYVAEAKRRGYRSRAAFKLEEIDDRLKLLRPGTCVIDLGAAPGGWTQIAVARARSDADTGKVGRVIAVDILPMDAVPGAEILTLDFMADDAPKRIRAALGGEANLVLTDMAPPTTGHAPTDHLRIVALAEAAAEFALEVLAPGGAFVAKVWQGGTERALLDRLKRGFAQVRHMKPPSSRSESAELYVVATGFKKRAE
jgi:23S rRNA (uridine2552-2'-O)-methyltransferase